MRDRSRNMVVRVDDGEIAMAHALSEAADLPVAFLVRGWIRDHYRARFGDVAPPATTTRNTRRKTKR